MSANGAGDSRQQQQEAEGEDLGQALPFWAKFLKRKYTEIPGRWGFLFGAVALYLTQMINVLNAVTALLDGDAQSFAILMFGLIVPGIVIGGCMMVQLSMGDSTKAIAFQVSMRYAFNVQRGWEAWKYFQGTGPYWSGIYSFLCTQLAVCNVPTLAINLQLVVSSAEKPGLNTWMLILSSISSLLGVTFHPTLGHIMKGSPTNLDKYRLFNVDGPNAAQQMLFVFLCDTSSIYYRLGMFAVLYISAGWLETLAFFIFSVNFSQILFWENISQVPIAAKFKYLICASAVPGWMILDFAIFAPVAVNDVYLRHHIPYRAIQAGIAMCLVAQHHETLLAHPEQLWVWIAVAFTTFFLIVWLAASVYAHYSLFSKEKEEKRLQAQAFFNMLAERKRKQKEEAAKAAAAAAEEQKKEAEPRTAEV